MAHVARDGQTVFTAPRGLWWLSLLTLVLLVFLTLLVLGLGIGLFMTGYPLAGAFFVLLAAFFVVLLRQVLRNTRGLGGGWRVTLEGENLRLSLPAARSLTRPLTSIDRLLPLADIAMIETRLESYRSIGMANMNRSYALRLKDGSAIILGEDRAQNTSMAHHHIADTAQALVDRGIAMQDLGMSEGSGGLLGIASRAPPPIGTPPPPSPPLPAPKC